MIIILLYYLIPAKIEPTKLLEYHSSFLSCYFCQNKMASAYKLSNVKTSFLRSTFSPPKNISKMVILSCDAKGMQTNQGILRKQVQTEVYLMI